MKTLQKIAIGTLLLAGAAAAGSVVMHQGPPPFCPPVCVPGENPA